MRNTPTPPLGTKGMHMSRTYADYVRLAKECLASINCYQVQIAFYATKVCTIRHGGRSNGLYTLSDFSKDIGVNGKTLSGWASVYRCVIEKLDMDLDEVSVKDWEVATRVHALLKSEKKSINAAMGMAKAKDKGWKINAPSSKIKKLFKQYKRQRPVEAEVHSWTDSIITIKNKIRTRDLSGVSTESLLLLKNNLDQASENVTNYLLDERDISIGELI